MMRSLLLVACVAAACQSTTQQVPQGKIDTRVHTEYAEFRPVTIAVLPVSAPDMELRQGVRKEVYRVLPSRRYTPFRLDEVDARIDADGKFTGGSLDWDATLSVQITSWTPVRGTDFWSSSGKAELKHKTGEVLWTCQFNNYPIRVNSSPAEENEDEAAKEIAHILVGDRVLPSRLPDCPPPPRE